MKTLTTSGVSWVLGNIPDPGALDAATQLSGIIWWLEDGINVKLSYDPTLSAFPTCFDSNVTLYPGSRNTAYYSGPAILWTHTLFVRKYEVFSRMFLSQSQNIRS